VISASRIYGNDNFKTSRRQVERKANNTNASKFDLIDKAARIGHKEANKFSQFNFGRRRFSQINYIFACQDIRVMVYAVGLPLVVVVVGAAI